jgi:GcrA cell cycle regulator
MTRKKRIEAVLRLRRQGWRNTDIAARMTLTMNQVSGICNRAMRRGEIPHVPRTLGVALHIWTKDDEALLIARARRGDSNGVIAAAIGCTVNAVEARLSSLRAIGHAIPSRQKPPTAQPTRRRATRDEMPAAVSSPAAGREGRPFAQAAPPPARATPPREPAGGPGSPHPVRQPSSLPRISVPPVTLPRGPIPACRACQWPEDRPGGGYLFCGAPVRPGSPYCAAHHAQAHVTARPRDEVAA